MSQTFTTLTGSLTGSTLWPILNDNQSAQRSSFSGTTAPTSPTPVEGQLFAKTDTNVLQVYGGASWVTIVPDYTAAGGGLLPLTGGTMSGSIAMGANQITGVANGTAATDAINKQQADALRFSSTVFIDGLAATANHVLWVAPAACTIVDVKLLSGTSTTGSGAGDNYTFNVRNVTQAEDLRSAAKSTNGAEITLEVVYALALDQNLTGIAANDVLRLTVVKTGSPTSLTSARIVAEVIYTLSA